MEARRHGAAPITEPDRGRQVGASLLVYGIVGAGTRLPPLPDVVGPSHGGVRLVEDGPLAAVVGSLESSSVRATRANLRAHEAVVETLGEHGGVLPMRFGVVVESEVMLVSTFLTPCRQQLTRLLGELRDKCEMRVEARFAGDTAMREVVASNPSVKRLQAKIRSRSEAASYYDRLSLGRLVQEALQEMSYREASRLGRILDKKALRSRQLAAPDDEVLLRAAFLLPRNDVASFDAAVAQLAASEEARIAFTLVGPLAPWDFAEFAAPIGRGERVPAPAGAR